MEAANSVPHTKVDEFKRLYKTVIPNLPTIFGQTSTGTWKYPPPTIPDINTNGPIELVLDSDIPACLINGLDGFVNGLEEHNLDADMLSRANNVVVHALQMVGDVEIRTETSVLPGFTTVVGHPVWSLCRALGVEASYAEGPRVRNLNPDHAWFVQNEPVIIFEHKIPAVFDLCSPRIVSMARQRQTLDLRKSSTNGESIIANLIMASLINGFDYCVVHSLASFIVIRLVQLPESGRYQARISNVIPLTSPTTPIIPLALALILHSRQDDFALEYQPLGLTGETSNDTFSEQDGGSHLGPSTPKTHDPTNQREDGSSGNRPAGIQTLASSPPYWELKEVSQTTLAAMLQTTDVISFYWEMKPYSQDVYHPVRRDDSSLWADPLPRQAIPRLVFHSQGYNHVTPPPSPPMTPFVLRLNSAAGTGAVGTAYQGQFLGLSVPIVVKILPTDRMDHELEIWRTLRNLAGIGIPGLFGAYSLEGQEGREDTGALVQQYAEATLKSFDTLNREQRCELYSIATGIHETGVEHGDLEPRNIALDRNGRVMVLDFSHSSYHDCEGERDCEELQYLRQELELLK